MGDVAISRNDLSVESLVRLPAREELMFHVVAEGSCWLRCDGSPPIQLQQGDLVLLPPGFSHDLVHDPANGAEPKEPPIERTTTPTPDHPSAKLMSGFFGFNASIAGPMLRSLSPVIPFPASRVRANAAMFSIVNLLTAELDRPGPGSEGLVRHLLDSLFVYIARDWVFDTEEGGFNWLAALRDVPLSKALGHMHAAPGAPWTVQSLARSAELSRATFARRFTNHMGEPPLGYLTRWRMLLAAKELTDGNAPVSEVARGVGYDSEFAFSRAFKRYHGVAPSGYRRGTNLPAIADAQPPPEMATIMGPEADRTYVSVFEASGISPPPRYT
jgi:AraC-like DNA-binding protein